jgi:hypothetical protein
MRRLALIAGNGLTIDLRQFLSPSLENWDPQSPLHWRLAFPGTRQDSLLARLPHFYRVVSELRSRQTHLSDFDIFDLALDGSSDTGQLAGEMRNFLALAYSTFQLQVDRCPMDGWSWYNWIRDQQVELTGVVSFNYDLVVERALAGAGLPWHRFGVCGELSGVPILKPHGSIDFETDVEQRSSARNTGTPLRRLERNELLRPRRQANIVLPKEYSPLLDYAWVEEGYRWFREVGPSLTDCVIAGLSYWRCDRPEIDYVLRHLSADVQLVIANPRPPQPFLAQIRRMFRREAQIWEFGPPEWVGKKPQQAEKKGRT